MDFRVDKKKELRHIRKKKIALTPIYTKGLVVNNGVVIAPLDF
jgi:hypothetical protein